MQELILNPRTRIKLTKDERDILSKYLKDDPAPLKTIQLNTGISKKTIYKTMERGWVTFRHAELLKQFIKQIKSANLV